MKKKPMMERTGKVSDLVPLILAALAFGFAPSVLAEGRSGAGIGGGAGGDASGIVVNGGTITTHGGGVGVVSQQMVSEIAAAAAEAARAAAFDDIYPVGSVCVSTNANASLPVLFTQGGRQWVRLASGVCLWNTANGGGGKLSGSLPNITGSQRSDRGFIVEHSSVSDPAGFTGAFRSSATSHGWAGFVGDDSRRAQGSYQGVLINFDASRCSSVYSAAAGSDVVRPTSIAVSMWLRVR